MDKVKHIHFIGICGTAMGNIAIGLKNEGYVITGSDSNIYPPISTLLEKNDIEILEFNENNVKSCDLVVIGNAIARGNKEVEYVLDNKVSYLSLPQVINNFFLKNKKLIMVTGTHGKTTTTALITHILKESGLNPSFMIGGIPLNFKSGFYNDRSSEYFVMEGDEYDTAFFDKTSKFLKFTADYLVVNYIEFDHGDIFDSLKDIKKSFRFLLRKTPAKSIVFLNNDDINSVELKQHCYSKIKSFGTKNSSTVIIEKLAYGEGKMNITLKDGNNLFSFKFKLPGVHNGRNAAAAYTVAKELGVQLEKICLAMESFLGVKRRFELIGENRERKIDVFEDFAHHPTAIKETLEGIRRMFSSRKIIAVFEPATNTIRSGFFEKQLVESLSLADKTIVLPVPKKKTQGASDTFDTTLFKEKKTFTVLDKIEEFENEFSNIIENNLVVVFMSNSSLQKTNKLAIKLIEELENEI